MKPEAYAWLARQFIGIDDQALSVVNRFRRAVDGKAEGEAWCVGFVQYLAREIDYLFDDMHMTASAKHALPATESTQVMWAQATTKLSAPVAGSIVVWRSKANPLLGHCGVVIATGPDGLLTVEGNTSQPGVTGDERNGRGVWRKARFGGDVPGFDRLGYMGVWA